MGNISSTSDGLSITSNGSIQGVPLLRSDWINYEIWSNIGGSFVSNLWIVVHDIQADQADLLYGMGGN